jgi:hypothetical protein
MKQKQMSPRLAAYLARQAAMAKDRARRNKVIVKALKSGAATVPELAHRYGVTAGTIRSIYAATAGHPVPYAIRTGNFAHCNRRHSAAYLVKRALAIVEARQLGVTLRVLADRFDVGPERIRQLHHLATRRDYVAKVIRKARISKRRG